MNGETITLIIYGSIALILAIGGIYSLRKGFQLIANGNNKSIEESTITFLGLHVTTGSIGAMVMITSFMWGWAAKMALPQYKDGNITTKELRQQLAVAQTNVKSLTTKTKVQSQQLTSLKSNIKKYVETAENNEKNFNELLIEKGYNLSNPPEDEKQVIRQYKLNKDALSQYKDKMKIK